MRASERDAALRTAGQPRYRAEIRLRRGYRINVRPGRACTTRHSRRRRRATALATCAARLDRRDRSSKQPTPGAPWSRSQHTSAHQQNPTALASYSRSGTF
eukprot:366363-Chlamydomonas_euryale.AAC.16